MDNILQTALADAVNSLANFFGTTTEAIMTRAPEFLAKYGWYSTLSNLHVDIFISLLIVGVICLFGALIFLVSDMYIDVELKHPVIAIICITIIVSIIIIVPKIITCAVAPEIVGAHAIMDLLKNMK